MNLKNIKNLLITIENMTCETFIKIKNKYNILNFVKSFYKLI